MIGCTFVCVGNTGLGATLVSGRGLTLSCFLYEVTSFLKEEKDIKVAIEGDLDEVDRAIEEQSKK